MKMSSDIEYQIVNIFIEGEPVLPVTVIFREHDIRAETRIYSLLVYNVTNDVVKAFFADSS